MLNGTNQQCWSDWQLIVGLEKSSASSQDVASLPSLGAPCLLTSFFICVC